MLSYSVNMEVDGSAANDESGRPNSVSKTPKIKDAASRPSENKILYNVEECPPWYICIFLGLQVGCLNRYQFRNISRI